MLVLPFEIVVLEDGITTNLYPCICFVVAMPRRKNKSQNEPSPEDAKADLSLSEPMSQEQEDEVDLSWPERMIQEYGDGDKSNISLSSTQSYSFSSSVQDSSYLDRSSQSQRSPPVTTQDNKFDYGVHPRPTIHGHLEQLSKIELDSRGKKEQTRAAEKETDFKFCINFVFTHKYCILLIGGLFFLIKLYLSGGVPEDSPPAPLMKTQPRAAMVKHFDDAMRDVMAKFPNQDARFWKVIKATSKGVLREPRPMQPATIMLAGHRDNARVIECIAGHVTQTFTAAYQGSESPRPATLSAYDYDQYRNDAAGLKRHIEHSVRAALGGASRAVHVSELQRIPGPAAAMFHAFCDNDNAPHKDAAIVFTVHAQDAAAVQDENAVEDYLTDTWAAALDLDTLTPLLSRIANSIALVRAEGEQTLDKHCQ